MSSEPNADDEPGEEDAFEAFTADCIEALEQRGPGAFEELLAARPGDAEAVRRRVASLSKVGLLSLPKDGWEELIGPYRVVRRLGSGGMGEVVLGEHSETGQQAAIKLGPLPQAALTPDHERHARRAAERFAREVRAVSELRHPAIVPIVEVGQHRGRAWFAMEFVGLDRVLEAVRSGSTPAAELTGEDLAAAIPGASADAFGSTWVGAIGRIVRSIAGALIEAHAAGIVHRDIKPSNILLAPDGRVQIVDFGLAHLDDMPTLTLSGEFAGTPYYVAPEQIENVRGGLDGRADQFSLGVTLYECASLQRPFSGRTPLEVLTAISTREPEPLRRAAPHLPADLERLCAKALEKKPALRYANMAAFAEDLDRLLQFRPLLAKPPGSAERVLRWARRRPWRAASAALAATLAIGTPVGLLAANSQIRSERDRVAVEARRNALVVEHFVQHFEPTLESGVEPGAESEAGPVDEAARTLLDRGARRLQHGLAEEPGVRASLLHASGRAYLELGRPADARPLLDRALGIWLREGEAASDERARVLADLARVHLEENRPGIARDLARRALVEISAKALDEALEQRVRTTIAAALLALGQVDLAKAELASLGAASEAGRADVASVWESIGSALVRDGDPAAARDAFQSSLDLHVRAWSPDGRRLARVHEGLADALQGLGEEAEAREHRGRALRLRSIGSSKEERARDTALPGPRYPFLGEPVWAQAYAERFDRGVAALQAGRMDEARDRFLDAHAACPSMSVVAYNLACVESRAANLDEAAQWLERARQAGFACTAARWSAVEQDVELQALRDSGAGVFQRLRQQWESARAYAAESRTVPATAGTKGPKPLLVVLHDHGASVGETVAGEWAELAKALGATLLAPCGPYLVGPTTADGSGWSPDPRDLWAQPEAFGHPVLDEVRAALKSGSADPENVWIAGRGLGALLALDLLAENPGLFRRGWLLDPCLHERSGAASGRLARALGGRLAVSITGAAPPPEALARTSAEYAEDVERWLKAAGGWVDAVMVERNARPAEADVLGWWSDPATR